MSVFAMIKRSFSHISIESFRILYNTYVRPYLEYCVQIWNPYLKKDIECIEKIQSLCTFKRSLMVVDFSKFLKCV